MLRLAECEKAVTNSEAMGCAEEDSRVPTGSKTPLKLLSFVLIVLFAEKHGSSSFCRAGSRHSVFNGLQAEKARRGKRWRGTVDYLLGGHVDSTTGARFGPNFVTILPTGVCVCSI